MGNSKDRKIVRLKYNLSCRRSYLNKIFPNPNPELNCIEVDEEMAETFLRMKIGRDRVWSICSISSQEIPIEDIEKEIDDGSRS